MKLYDTMTAADRKIYMQLLAAATSGVITPDAMFVLVVMSKSNRQSSYTSSIEREEMPELLREMADVIEHDLMNGN